MRHAKQRKKDWYCTSLNLPRAFDSVSHHALLDAARVHGLPGIDILKDLYHNCSTTFFWEGQRDHERVPLQRGIKQGTPFPPSHSISSWIPSLAAK